MPPGDARTSPELRRPNIQSNDEDSFRRYLKEIGRIPLLTGEEEVSLALTMRAGNVASEQLRAVQADETAEISRREKVELTRAIREGKAAQDHMIEANLRLVVSIAKRYVGRGMLLPDLVQEGNLGLHRASVKFDPDKGFKFSTYATWWIRQSVTRAIADQGKTIRIPVHMNDKLSVLSRTERNMYQNLQREPTIEELADELNVAPTRVLELLNIAAMTPLSLDQPVGEDDSESSGLSDFIPDLQSQSLIDDIDPIASQNLQDALMSLSERERMVIVSRYGLDGGAAKTLEEVGKEFHVTRERIRQIASKAEIKLRTRLRAADADFNDKQEKNRKPGRPKGSTTSKDTSQSGASSELGGVLIEEPEAPRIGANIEREDVRETTQIIGSTALDTEVDLETNSPPAQEVADNGYTNTPAIERERIYAAAATFFEQGLTTQQVASMLDISLRAAESIKNSEDARVNSR